MSESSNRASDHNKFLDGLRVLPAQMIERLLDGQLCLAADKLLASQAEVVDPRTKLFAILNFSLCAQAKHQRLEINNPEIHQARSVYKLPNWLATARSELKAYMAQDPTERIQLKNTVFFSDDYATVRTIERLSENLTYPGGPYDSASLSAGVAIGRICIMMPKEI
jgi:hypothetical protein